jgi:hypothetical protein
MDYHSITESLQRLNRFITGNRTHVEIRSTRRIQLPANERLPPVRRTHVEIRRRPTPYWQEAGWARSGGEFTGRFRARDETFPGRIVRVENATWEYHIFIEQPWPKLQQHRKWPCFWHSPDEGPGWRVVHWRTKPRSLDSGIQDIENTLWEALEE